MKKREYFMEKKPARAIALLPIGVFLVLYLGLGCLFEYGLKIEMGFYNIALRISLFIVFAFRSAVKGSEHSLVKLHKNTPAGKARIKLTAFLHFRSVQNGIFLIK